MSLLALYFVLGQTNHTDVQGAALLSRITPGADATVYAFELFGGGLPGTNYFIKATPADRFNI